MENWATDNGFDFQWIEFDGTQAAVLDTKRHQVLVFRGTSNVQDWLTNLDAWTVKRPEFTGEVHQGFYDALMVVLDDIVHHLQSHKILWITGHSLGGALATLASGLFRGTLYTFGSPRVGNKEFSEVVFGNRFTNNNDIVPRVPIGDYKHVGTNYHFTHNGKLWKDPSWGWLEWDRIVGRLKFRVADGIRDHSIDEYVSLIQKAASA